MRFINEFTITLALLFFGFIFGTINETNHLNDLRRREKKLLKMSVRRESRKKSLPLTETDRTILVMGSVVIASDYFKNFISQLKNFFGGRLTAHESLMDRARREAILRMKEEAYKLGAHEVVGFHLETSALDKAGIEIFAYGTAVIRESFGKLPA